MLFRSRGRGPRSGAGLGRPNRSGHCSSRAGDRAELRRRGFPCRRGGATQKTNQPERAAGVFLPGRRTHRSGFVTEPRDARKWLEGASPETRTDWSKLEAVRSQGRRSELAPRALFGRGRRATKGANDGAGRGGAASAGVFPGGRVWGFRGRQPRPGPGGYTLCAPCLYPREDNRVAPRGAAIAVDGRKTNGKGAATPAAKVGRAPHPPLHTRQVGGAHRAPPSIRNRSLDPYKVGRRLYSPVKRKLAQ